MDLVALQRPQPDWLIRCGFFAFVAPSKLQLLPHIGTAGTMLEVFSKGIDTMPIDYSLSDLLDRLYENQHALEAAIMELTLLVEEQGTPEVGGNIRGALETMKENAVYIKQGLARLRNRGIG